MKQTSIDNYIEIKESGVLSGLRLEAYDILRLNGELTGSEVAQLSSRKRNPHCISPRFAELEQMGAIEASGVRPCKVTGKNATTWRITGKIPTKFDPKKKIGKKQIWLLRNEEAEVFFVYDSYQSAMDSAYARNIAMSPKTKIERYRLEAVEL